MKVKQLIELLQKEDPNLMVVISGYEGGVDELEMINNISIKLNQNQKWYYGKHEEVENGKGDVMAVLI